MRIRVATLIIAAVCGALLLAAPATAAAGPGVLKATLTPGAVPTGGHAGGSGEAYVAIDPASGRVCTVVVVRGVPEIIAAHIHKGAAGEQGPHAIDLDTPADLGASTTAGITCAVEPPSLVADLLANPSGYYVNVHSFARPLGAVRGQLVSLTGGAAAS
ncbi:MAG: CHRD domain-containing protein [Acidimicrobiales bacterium]